MASKESAEYRYVISYDLLQDGRQDYDLIESLLADKLGAKRLLQSVWGLRASLTKQQIFNKLIRVLSKGDRLLIVTVIEHGWIGRRLENQMPRL